MEIDPETDEAQLAFELYAPFELANYLSTLNRDPGIVDLGRRAIRETIGRARPPSSCGPPWRLLAAKVGRGGW